MSMEDGTIAPRALAGIRGRLTAPARWKLWSERPRFIAYCLGVEATVVALTAVTAVAVPAHPRDVIMLGALAGLGVLQAELGRGVERIRRRVDNTPHFNLTSVWTFAGVLLLPPALTAALVAVLYLHLALRSWQRLRNTPPFRTIFNASLATLTCFATYRVATWSGISDIYDAQRLGWSSIGNLAAAITVYFWTAAIIALPGLKPAKRKPKQLIGGWVDNALEVATLCAGAVVALILVSPLPFLVVAIVQLLVFVHRGVLYKQFEVLASTDEKTGLFNTAGWHFEAAETLTRAEREHQHGAVLMADLDHFKRVNDTYGHLAGDAVLKAIAGVLRENLRAYDSAARFGGEEFVILLVDITAQDAWRVAERIRVAVTQLEVQAVTTNGRVETITNLSVSIGVSLYPEAGFGVDPLIVAADTALRIAKGMGRDRVQMASVAA